MTETARRLLFTFGSSKMNSNRSGQPK